MGDVRVRDLGGGRWEVSLPARKRAVKGLPPLRPRRVVEASDEAEAEALGEEVLARDFPSYRLAAGMDTCELVLAFIAHQRRCGAYAPETAHDYELVVLRYLAPNFSKPADAVSVHDIDALYRLLLGSGRADGTGLSVRSLRKLHSIVSNAYDWMVRELVVPANPLRSMRLPKAETAPKRALSEMESAAILAEIRRAIEGPLPDGMPPVRRVYAMAAWTAWWIGVRAGEVCAILRRNVFYARGRIEISGSVSEKGHLRRKGPKTASGHRMLSPGRRYMDSLRAYGAWERSAWLDPATEVTEDTPLFCRRDGGLLRPSKVSQAFKEIAGAAGIALKDGEAFHILRHTNLSYVIEEAPNPMAAQHWGGHGRFATTADNYGHAMSDGGDEIAAAMEDVTERIEGRDGL